jgi:hypothetical protein
MRAEIGVGAQIHDPLPVPVAHHRVAVDVADRRRRSREAVIGRVKVDDFEPGAVDELEEPLGGRGGGLGLRRQARFHVGQGHHVDRIDAGHVSRLEDGMNQPALDVAAAERNHLVRIAGRLGRRFLRRLRPPRLG